MEYPEKSKCFQGFWGANQEQLTCDFNFLILSGKKRGNSPLLFISMRKDYRIRYKHPHPQHLKETAGKDLHHIWYRILPWMKASNRYWYPLPTLFCIWNNWMKTWQ